MSSRRNAGSRLFIHENFVYAPLLLDPEIAEAVGNAEITGRRRNRNGPVRKKEGLLDVSGRRYIRVVSLRSLVETFPQLHPESYGRMRAEALSKYRLEGGHTAVAMDEKLRAILFAVMPHFVRRRKKLGRTSFSESEILDLIGEKILIPPRYLEAAEAFFNLEAIRRTIGEMDRDGRPVEPPRNGPVAEQELREWIRRKIVWKIVESEKRRLETSLEERERFSEVEKRHLSILLYVADRGALEIDGFGFFRIASSGEYIAYVHTGEYALKDSRDGLYVFPDCRVGVSTDGPLSPRVLESYKHPLLAGHREGQKICVRRFFIPRREFSAENMIGALEEGVKAMFYGYNRRRRNGYNMLDATRRHMGMIDFNDYLVGEDDPRIAVGEVEVKNDFD